MPAQRNNKSTKNAAPKSGKKDFPPRQRNRRIPSAEPKGEKVKPEEVDTNPLEESVIFSEIEERKGEIITSHCPH